MFITSKLKNFLNLSKNLSYSDILLTDLNSVIFVASYNKNNYLNQEISNDLKQILKLYSSDQSFTNYMNTTTDLIIPITKISDSNHYQSQIVLPIVQDNKVEGLLIFLTKKERYLISNLNFAKTTKHFVEIFCTKNYL